MSFPRYPEYKDSGVEWLGKVPKHWSVKQAKYTFVLQRGHDLSNDNLREGAYPVQGSNGTIGSHEKFTTQGPNITVGRSGSVGAINYIRQDFWAHNTALFVKDFRGYPPRFIFYLLFAINPSRLAAGSAVGTLDRNRIHSQVITSPPWREAKSIANFLDHETTKIDNLIHEQKRLIELLKEKRQAVISHAVISHAVTKGLDPDVPMKDSGVEWLGEVPAHWKIGQLKFNAKDMQTGPFGSQLHAEDYIIDGIPLINPAHMVESQILPDRQVTVDEPTHKRLHRHQLASGDLIFARRGELGRCAVVTDKETGWLCGTGSLRIRLNSRLLPRYALLLASSEGVVSDLRLESKGSTMENLNTETLGKIRIPIPPVYEQEQIIEFIQSTVQNFEPLIDEAVRANRLILERRSALISAAVTGKIDVRNWEPPADESAFDEEFLHSDLEQVS